VARKRAPDAPLSKAALEKANAESMEELNEAAVRWRKNREKIEKWKAREAELRRRLGAAYRPPVAKAA
jgi:hypothetical protein